MYAVTTSTDLLVRPPRPMEPPPEVVPPTAPEAATLPRSRGPRRPQVNLWVESGWNPSGKWCAHGTRGHQACQGSIWPIQAAGCGTARTRNLVREHIGGEPRPRYARRAAIQADWSAYRGASAVPRPGRGWRTAGRGVGGTRAQTDDRARHPSRRR